jgi:osmotically-inducible protein OsmY
LLLLSRFSVALVIAAACGHSTASQERRADTQRPEGSGEQLEGRIRARLFADPELAGSGSIVVIVDGRHVVLEGWVASVNERTLAEADVATVVGAAAVDDRLLVRPPR